MTPLGGRLMAELLAKDLDQGVVHFDGQRLLTSAGVEVEPRLSFVPDDEVEERAPAAGIRLGANYQDEEMTYRMFARLPQERLTHSDPQRAKAAERAQRAALRAAMDRRRQLMRTTWPGKGFARLPEDQLVKKGDRS